MAVEMLATWWVRQEGLRRGAAFAVLGGVGGAPEAGLSGEDAEHGHEDSAERAGGLGVVEADAMTFGQGVSVLPFARLQAPTKPSPVARSKARPLGSPICLRPKTSLRRLSAVQPNA